MTPESLPASDLSMPDPRPETGGGAYLDSLPLRSAVLARDLVLQEPCRRRYLIHALSGGRVRRVGRFTDAASAWRALDELDDPLRRR